MCQPIALRASPAIAQCLPAVYLGKIPERKLLGVGALFF
jgi:hypothetical protein